MLLLDQRMNRKQSPLVPPFLKKLLKLHPLFGKRQIKRPLMFPVGSFSTVRPFFW